MASQRYFGSNRGLRISRRTFLGAGAAGGTALLGGGFGLASLLSSPAHATTHDPAWIERTIPELQGLMGSGALTSRELTRGYLQRIAQFNPLLRAVIETNPRAEAIAVDLDNERRKGHGLRGPLHGIPVLVKDNIATDDQMETTAGSLALVGSRVPADAVAIQNLRAAGAVILGKANLGEWANFRGFTPPDAYGWSARGGNTRNPYVLDYTPWGSSSGPAVGVVSNLCAAAVGTETDGSIVGPANVNLAVGLKPTLGLISQRGIIPISLEADTAGPICRTVTDVAVMLGVMQSPFGAVLGHPLPTDYTQFLRRGALRGARIGVDQRYFDGYATYGNAGDDDTIPFVQHALAAMQAMGATLVLTDSGDYLAYTDDDFAALLMEFKAHLNQYLAGLTHSRNRTLADLIAFNNEHCRDELKYYGQELFEMAEATSGDLTDGAYLAARSHARTAARAGIDNALARDDLDAIIAPHLTNSVAPAVSGYPNLALPVGIRDSGKPAGLMMYSTFLQEPTLIGFAYDLEQALNVRRQPQFLGTATDPTNAGLCPAPPGHHDDDGNAHHQHRRNHR
jgi:amidase